MRHRHPVHRSSQCPQSLLSPYSDLSSHLGRHIHLRSQDHSMTLSVILATPKKACNNAGTTNGSRHHQQGSTLLWRLEATGTAGLSGGLEPAHPDTPLFIQHLQRAEFSYHDHIDCTFSLDKLHLALTFQTIAIQYLQLCPIGFCVSGYP